MTSFAINVYADEGELEIQVQWRSNLFTQEVFSSLERHTSRRTVESLRSQLLHHSLLLAHQLISLSKMAIEPYEEPSARST